MSGSGGKNSSQFECMLCDTKYETISARNDHEIKNHFKGGVNCYLKGCKFSVGAVSNYHDQRLQLNNHINEQHPSFLRTTKLNKEKCIVCGIQFFRKNTRTAHEQAIHFPGYNSCAVDGCEWKLNKPSRCQCIKHYKRRHLKLFKCQFCLTYFASKEERINHQKNICLIGKEYAKNMYLCPEKGCDFKTSNRGSARVHFDVYHSDNVHKCNECDFTCKWQASLCRHKNTIHGSEKRFKCTVCEMTFTQRCSVNRHMRTAHPEQATAATTDSRKKWKRGIKADRRRKKQLGKGRQPRKLKRKAVQNESDTAEEDDDSFVSEHSQPSAEKEIASNCSEKDNTVKTKDAVKNAAAEDNLVKHGTKDKKAKRSSLAKVGRKRMGKRKRDSAEDKKKTESSKPKVAEIKKGIRKKFPGESITAVAGSTNHVNDNSPTSSHKNIIQNMLDSDRDGGEIDIETNTQVTGKRRTDEGDEAAGVPVIDKTHKNSDGGENKKKKKTSQLGQ